MTHHDPLHDEVDQLEQRIKQAGLPAGTRSDLNQQVGYLKSKLVRLARLAADRPLTLAQVNEQIEEYITWVEEQKGHRTA